MNTTTDSSIRRELIENDLQSRDFYFRYFRNINELVEVGKRYSQELFSSGLTTTFTNEWKGRGFGSAFVGGSKSQAEEGPFFKNYIDERALSSSTNAFEELLSEIDMGGAFKKAKLTTTEKSTGIFDFGLASPGLYALQEFYSKKLGEKFPFEFAAEIPGIVPPMFVNKNPMGDFWYKSKEKGEMFQMTKQKKGEEALRLKLPGAKYKYATSIKKVYVTFKREGGKANYVDLYVGCGGLATLTSTGMLARALPVMMAARYFEMMGIRTRINAARTYEAGNRVVCIAWTIKDYGSDLDFKRIAIDTADSRFFRWNLWKWSSAILEKEFGVGDWGYGSTVYGGQLLLEIKNRWRNWYFEQMQENKVPYVNLKPELMLFGGLYPPPNSWTYSGPNDKTFLAIKQEFLNILDTVDFSFNKPQDAIQRIYQRKVIEEGESMDRFTKYVSSTLSKAYSFPTRGDYATPKDVQAELIENYKERSRDFSKYLVQLQN